MQGVSSREKDSQKSPPEPRSTVVFMTIADTTWRMFVPSIGCTFLGIWVDSKLGTAPWLLFVGVAVGFIIAGLAVRLQYKKLINL